MYVKNIPCHRCPSFILLQILSVLSLAGVAGADQLTFIPSGTPVNYSWFSAGNWFTNGTVNPGLSPCGRIPVPTDTAVIAGNSSVNAAGNTIHLVSLSLSPNAAVNGGTFIVSTLQIHGGLNGNVTSFNNSVLEALSEMDVYGGSCYLNSSSLTIDFGATCFVGAGGTGQLNLSGSVVYNAGQIVLYPNSDSFLGGGTNLFNFPGAVISGSSNVVLAVSGGNFDNSGTVRCDGGTFNASAYTWSSTNQIGKFKTSVTNALLLFSSGMTIPTNVTYIFSGPGMSQFPNGATVQGTAQVGVYDTNLVAWDNGALQYSGTLAGTGVVYVAAAPGFPSELDGVAGTLNGPTVNLDSGGNLNFSASSGNGNQISGGVVNNSGTTTWKSGDLYVDAPGVFNNLASGLFDAQATNVYVDGTIYGNDQILNGIINNYGTFRKSRGSHAVLFSNGPNFNNAGLLDVQSGQVQLSGGVNTSTFNVAPGAEIWFVKNTNTFAAGAQIAGTNFVRVNSGAVLLLNTNLTLANFQLNYGGTVDGASDLTVTNLFNWTAGTLQGGGAVNIPVGATLNNSGNQGFSYYITNRTVNNAGTIILTNGFITPDSGAIFNNLAGALLEIDKDGGVGFPNATLIPRPVLNNYGTIRNLSPTTAPLAFNITNQGVVLILTNHLNCYQYHQLAGATTVASNVVLAIADNSVPFGLQGGTLTAAGTIQANVVNSGGSINLGNSPGILTINGSTGIYTQTVSGVLSVKIGGTSVGNQYDRLFASGGVLGGTLNVSFINGFNPSLGDQYRVVASTYGGSYTGTFTTLNGLHATNGLVLVPVYGYYAGYYFVTLVAVNELTLSASARSGNQFAFEFPSTAGFTNVVEYTDSLTPANWRLLTNIIGDGALHSVTDSATNSAQRFYRMRFE